MMISGSPPGGVSGYPSVQQIQVTCSADADAGPYSIAHGMGSTPRVCLVYSTNAQGNTALDGPPSVDAQNVVLKKKPVVGSGGAQWIVVLVAADAVLAHDIYVKGYSILTQGP